MQQAWYKGKKVCSKREGGETARDIGYALCTQFPERSVLAGSLSTLVLGRQRGVRVVQTQLVTQRSRRRPTRHATPRCAQRCSSY